MMYVCSECGAVRFVDSTDDEIWGYCRRCRKICRWYRKYV